MKYIIQKFKDEDGKKLVGFLVKDANGNNFVIDKRVEKTGTDENMIAAAQAASQSEIDEWQAQFAVIGMVWNTETNTLAPEPVEEPVE